MVEVAAHPAKPATQAQRDDQRRADPRECDPQPGGHIYSQASVCVTLQYPMAGKSESDPDPVEPKQKKRKAKASARPRRLRRGRPLTPLIPRPAKAKKAS